MSNSCVIPSFSITRADLTFSTWRMLMMRSRPQSTEPNRRAAVAASVAYPDPQDPSGHAAGRAFV